MICRPAACNIIVRYEEKVYLFHEDLEEKTVEKTEKNGKIYAGKNRKKQTAPGPRRGLTPAITPGAAPGTSKKCCRKK